MNKKISQLVAIFSLMAIIFTIFMMMPLHVSFAKGENAANSKGAEVATFSECKNAYLRLYKLDKSDTDANNDVIKQLKEDIKGFDAINAEFIKKIDAKLKTTQPSSSLTNQMVREYVMYKKEILNEFSKIKINGTHTTFSEQQYVINVCRRDRDIALTETKNYMMQFIKNNAAKKKSARLVEKFEHLNEKMQGFDSTLSTFYNLILTMKSKLPNFVSNCLTASK